jgi:hypothetical protein
MVTGFNTLSNSDLICTNKINVSHSLNPGKRIQSVK